MEKEIRYRVNVTSTTKGVFTFECTVDGTNYEMADILRKSDELVAELKKRYPTPPI